MSLGDWTDGRLDDLAAAVRGLPDRMTRLEGKVDHIASESHICLTSVDELRRELKADREARIAERDQARAERTSDRRWIIGTTLTVCAILIAAIGLASGLVNHL